MNTPFPIFIVASSLLTPLGNGVDENWQRLIATETGVKKIHDERFFSKELHLAKLDENLIEEARNQFNTSTRFDSILLKCAAQIQKTSLIDLSSSELLIILSTTKGNIELLNERPDDERLLLSYSAKLVQQFLQNPNEPIVVSNACISGLSGVIIAKRLLLNNQFKHALVIGCDVLSNFVISGFNSFHALSDEVCKPFDINRKGINLGEACAAVILSKEIESEIIVQGGFITNDANHISGPSKTGEELSVCISQSLNEAQLSNGDIDFISAHGTATVYNDEMESNAFALSGLHHNPVFSLKAVYGHTLGAAGLLDIIISIACLKRGIILPSSGYEKHGVREDVTISNSIIERELHHCLKTASGFGGCNAGFIISRI